MKFFKWTIIFFITFLSFNTYADSESFFEYEWSKENPQILHYVEKNKKRIVQQGNITYEKSSKYREFIENTAKEYGVPKEIFVLAALESEFNPKANNSNNAVGMWQFLKKTSTSMGLTVNDDIDERENWKKSTVAAIKYIKYLSENEFDGNYELGLLAYNAGSGRIKNSIEKYQTVDAWELIRLDKTLRKETREYLPKFIAYASYYSYLDEKNKKILSSN